MTDILIGAKIRAADWPATVFDSDDTDIFDITSLTFITGSPEVSVTFTAPTSGKVLVTIGGGLRDNSGIARVIMAPNVFRGSDATGTEVLATTSTLATELTSSAQATTSYFASRSYLLTGLTAQAGHYARLVYKVTGGSSGDISHREIMVRPMP